MKPCLCILFSIWLPYIVHGQSSRLNKDKFTIAIYGDYLREDLQWSIAGNSNGQNPNVLSELKWKDLKLRGAGLDINIAILHGIYFSGSYHTATIYSGYATDTDYGEDNKKSPTYQAIVNSDKGRTYSYFAGLGYKYSIYSILNIFPYAGYSKNKQSLFLNESNIELLEGEKKLNSSYQTNWAGPLIGLAIDAPLKSWFSIQADFSIARLAYTGLADWNMIDSFAHPLSFKHKANSYQNNINLKIDFKVVPKITIFLKGEYIHADTGKGTDQLFLNDGHTLHSQFNGAERNNKGIALGVYYRPVL